MVQIEEKKKEQLDPLAFAYWLQGFFEMSDAKTLDEKQVQVLKEHLELIFRKVPMAPTMTTTGTEQITIQDLQVPDRRNLAPFKLGEGYAVIC